MKYPTYKENITNVFDESKLMREDDITLEDDRPVHIELWSEAGYTFLSYYFSVSSIEDYSKEELIEYLEENGIDNINNPDKFSVDDISIDSITDGDKNKYFIVTINFGEV